MSKKLGFVLGSGGSRGVAHIGFLKAMEESDIKPDFITGSSMGAVVGSCYASGISPDEMKQILSKFKKNEILDLSGNILKAQSLFSSKRLNAKLHSLLGEKGFNDLDIPFACVSVDLKTGHDVVFKDKYKVADCVQASSTIPGIFKPVKIDDYLLVDGGIVNRLPIQCCKDLGAEVIVAIDVLGKIKDTDKPYNALSVLFRAIDIMDYTNTGFKLIDHKPDILIEPDMGNISQYKFNNFQIAYNAGYESGIKYIEEIKKLIN